MPTQVSAWSHGPESIPPLQLPEPSTSKNTELRRTFLLSAIRLEDISSLPTTLSPTLADTMLVDAIAAWHHDDYRRAILYSSIAIEAVAASALDSAHDRALAESIPSDRLRVVEMSEKGGAVRKLDPIFRALMKTDRFTFLLHEAALYMLGRSLLVQAQNLYRHAVELHTTRNKLAHGKDSFDAKGTLPLTRDGSLCAIRTAIKVFEWFGAGERFVEPDIKFENCQTGFEGVV
jgi:hypothetical protein